MKSELDFTIDIGISSIPVLFWGCILEIIFLISVTDVGFKNIELHIGEPKNSLNCFCGVASLFTNFSPIL